MNEGGELEEFVLDVCASLGLYQLPQILFSSAIFLI